jgi:hypothetical protein
MTQSDPLAPIMAKLIACIRMLASDNDGEVSAAGLGIRRLLKGAGVTIHAVAERIEKSSNRSGIETLSDELKQRIRSTVEQARATGYADGVTAAETRQHGTGAFRDTDGTLEWSEVALFVQRQKHRLDSKHHEFVDDMAARTVYGREPTPNQHKYLHSLFYKLGGKIT